MRLLGALCLRCSSLTSVFSRADFCRQVWEMKVSTGLLHQPGGRTSAKLTKGFRKQKRMRVDKDAGMAATSQPHAVQQLGEGGAGDGSDDEFAPPDALAMARMRARLAGDTQDDHMADL